MSERLSQGEPSRRSFQQRVEKVVDVFKTAKMEATDLRRDEPLNRRDFFRWVVGHGRNALSTAPDAEEIALKQLQQKRENGS